MKKGTFLLNKLITLSQIGNLSSMLNNSESGNSLLAKYIFKCKKFTALTRKTFKIITNMSLHRKNRILIYDHKYEYEFVCVLSTVPKYY